MISADGTPSLLLEVLLRFGSAIAIIVVGRWLARASRRWMGKLLVKTTLSDTIKELSLNVTYFVTYGMSILLALSVLGISTSTLLTVIAVVVVVLGIALQESIGNFAATVIFMLFEPFTVGDMIETGGVVGTVNEIQVFNTVLYQQDGKVVSLPNGKIQSDGVTNYSKLPSLRVDVEVGISYEDDLDKAMQTVHNLLAADPRVLDDPPARVFVLELDDSSVNLAVRPFVKGEDYWIMKWSLTEQLKRSFDDAGITIPFPQRDVHVVPGEKDASS
jgi:small conductance mechanosensitive channel